MKIFDEQEATLEAVDNLIAPKRTYYIWKNGVYNDTDKLDDDLFNYYAQDTKGINAIDELVANAYDSSVDKVELTHDEFMAQLDVGHKLNKGVDE